MTDSHLTIELDERQQLVLDRAEDLLDTSAEEIATESLNGGIERLEEYLDALGELPEGLS